MISPSRLRKLLNVGTVSAAASIVVVSLWGIRPVPGPVSSPTSPRSTASLRSPADPTRSDPDENTVIWTRSLQGPSQSRTARRRVTPPPAELAVVKPMPKSSAESLQLVGTVVEPGHSIAITSDRQGRLRFTPEGDRIDSPPPQAVVETIDDDGAWIRHNGARIRVGVGQPLSLSVATIEERPPEAPAAGSRPVDQTPATPMREKTIENPSRPWNVDVPADMNLEDELDWLNGG